MLSGIKAIIFDMDGVIIDSEPLWRRTMIRSFVEIGIPFTENDCRVTTGLRFKEVIDFWFRKYQISHISISDFDELVTTRLIELIKIEGKPMKGVIETMSWLKRHGYKIGLGTSSSVRLMNTVLDALTINSYFDALSSAEQLAYGKPHPEVFLACAQILQVEPTECLVIEDSLNGMIAGKAAQMKVLVIPDEATKPNSKFNLADHRLNSLAEFPGIQALME